MLCSPGGSTSVVLRCRYGFPSTKMYASSGLTLTRTFPASPLSLLPATSFALSATSVLVLSTSVCVLSTALSTSLLVLSGGVVVCSCARARPAQVTRNVATKRKRRSSMLIVPPSGWPMSDIQGGCQGKKDKPIHSIRWLVWLRPVSPKSFPRKSTEKQSAFSTQHSARMLSRLPEGPSGHGCG